MTQWKADPQNGLWLLPSRKRPAGVARFMKALAATNSTTPGVVITQRTQARDYMHLEFHPRWQLLATGGDTQGEKYRELWDRYCDLDWVGLVSDALVPVTDQWDTKLIEALNGWNFASCNDDWAIHGDENHKYVRVAGALVYSGPLLRAIGYIYPPGMNCLCLDDVIEALDMMEPFRVTLHDVLIKHPHYQNDPNVEFDDTYRNGYERNAGTDEHLWRQWRDYKYGMPAAAERIRALKESMSHELC